MADFHRSSDQKVEAFSAPVTLLNKALVKARELGMSKSGYFRYCLAKDLGYTDAEAKQIARDIRMQKAHAALRKSRGKKSK